jgi:hypothetical protein
MNDRAANLAGYVAGFTLLFGIWHLAAAVLVPFALFPAAAAGL